MNPTSKTTLQALGYGLAGVAAAAIANETARRVNPRPSPLAQLTQLNFLGRRKRFNKLFGKGTIASNLLSNPLFFNFGREKSVKRNLLRSALLGIGAGLGSLALPQQKRSIWRARGGRSGSGLRTIGRLVAGGLVAAAASRMLNRTLRDRHHHDRSIYEEHAHEQHAHEQHAHEQFG
ncbi:MAG TPA: hypothetical protein VJ810_04830 [Blastocatellia bacterium]|nr:hypothetical protein [Blastocatellia bacterium]